LRRWLVGAEPAVAVGPGDSPRRAAFCLQVGEERQHRGLDVVLVLAAVGGEPGLVVVGAQADEETLEVAPPPQELATRHAGRLSAPPTRHINKEESGLAPTQTGM